MDFVNNTKMIFTKNSQKCDVTYDISDTEDDKIVVTITDLIRGGRE